MMIPLFGDTNTGSRYWVLFKHGWATVAYGAPAVITFFVISGFCIHLPFRGSQRIDVPRYYLRRYTRILIPVTGALLVYHAFGQHLTMWGPHSILWESTLWSLACEEIYYAAYPFLRWYRNKFGWKLLLPVSFIVGVGLAATNVNATSWLAFGPFGTAVILLPVWLLGCLLAEQSESLLKSDTKISIWYWRFFAWFGSWVVEMLNFKFHVYGAQTLIWFGILAYFWLRQEIIHSKKNQPNGYLVAAGAWSYSLYLVHPQGAAIPARLHIRNLGLLPNWFLVMFSSLAFAYVFYLLVERPSHHFARKIRVKIPTTEASQKPVCAEILQETPLVPSVADKS